MQRENCDPGLMRSFQGFSQAAAIAVFAFGGMGLAGWIFDIPHFRSVIPGLATMKANTALGLSLSGISLWLWHRRPEASIQPIARTLGLMVALLGALTLGEYASGRAFGIDQLLFYDAPGAPQTPYPGRMSPLSALNFLLGGLSLTWLRTETRAGWRPAEFLALTAAAVATMAVIGYLYSVATLYQLVSYTGMAFHTALAFLCLSAGILCARPQRGLLTLWLSHGGGGKLVRRLLPFSLFSLLVLNWLITAGGRRGLYDPALVAPLSLIASLSIVTVLIWSHARTQQRAEQALRDSEARYRALAELSPDAILINVDDRISYVNPALVNLLGAAGPEQILGRSPFEIIHPDDHPVVRERIRRVLHGEVMPLIEEHFVKLDGTVVPVEVAAAPHADRGGRGIQVVLRDISERKLAEERLAASEISFRTLCESAPLGILKFDTQGRCTYCNQAWMEISGRDANENLGFGWNEATHPVERETVLSDWQRAAAEKRTWVREYRVLTSGREVRWIRALASPLCCTGDKPLGHVGTFMDMTERKLFEDTLHEQSKLLDLAQILACDLDGKIIFWNSGAERLFGWHRSEAIGQISHHLLQTRFPQPVAVIREQLFQTGAWEGELVHKTKQGRPIIVATHWALHRNIQGIPTAILEVNNDITDREQALQDLRRSEAEAQTRLIELETTYETAPIGLCVLDRELRFQRVNERFAEINGLPAADHVGRSIHEVVPKLAHQVEPLMRGVLDNGKPVIGLEVTGETPAQPGVQRIWLEHWFPLKDSEGQVLGINIVTEEITERKRAEAALREADRRKDEFLAMLAHELRNPLAPIRNAVQLLRKLGPKDPQLEWGRDVIDRQVSHMARLLDDLLDVARIMRGKISLKTTPMQIGDAIEYALEATRPSIEAKKQVLIISLPDKTLWVQGDLTRLAQVVANLLDNAMKYTDPGGRIRLSATEEADWATLRIQDTGVGIDPELLPHVFDLFTQAHQSLGRSQGGLGIGLTLTRQLVHLHGGTVTASSPGLDRGSEFTVRLPLLKNWCPLTERPMASSQAQPSSSSSKLRILVVDDYADAAQSLALLLRAEGHEVETADCGAAALERAANFQPQAVLLDIGLPDLDGYQVARRLRETPETRQAVLIALTGYGQSEDRERARNAGFDHFLLKPPDIDALSAVLATLA